MQSVIIPENRPYSSTSLQGRALRGAAGGAHSRHPSHASGLDRPSDRHRHSSTPEEDRLLRERRRAFTDFHNSGTDSSSAFLGDDGSNRGHRQSAGLVNSLAYPAGSAASKAMSRRVHASTSGGLNRYVHVQPSASFDPRRMTSAGSSGAMANEDDGGRYTPERALRPLRGTEEWARGSGTRSRPRSCACALCRC